MRDVFEGSRSGSACRQAASSSSCDPLAQNRLLSHVHIHDRVAGAVDDDHDLVHLPLGFRGILVIIVLRGSHHAEQQTGEQDR
jgi:hypothetical protein